jgi:predicted nucleic acid-binding protein
VTTVGAQALGEGRGLAVLHYDTDFDLIAAVAIRTGSRLLHQDSDFNTIALYRPLRICL